MNRIRYYALRPLLVLALLLAFTAGVAPGASHPENQGGPRLVILVRHAERAAEPAADPTLTAAGAARAQALSAALEYSGVTAIVTTEFTRTKETAAPLATRLGMTPEVVAARGLQPSAHAEAVANAVRKHNGGVVVVVGHSNTVPAIIAALGGERLRDICEAQYANMFILAPRDGGSSLVKSTYGAPDPSSPGCG